MFPLMKFFRSWSIWRFLIVIGIFYCMYNGFFSNTPLLSFGPEALRRKFEAEMIAKSPLVIHRFCGIFKDCYHVADSARWNSNNEKFEIWRELVSDQISKGALTRVFLQPPESVFTDEYRDTSKWKVNKRIVAAPLFKYVLASGFMIEVLNEETQNYNKILSYGLGGGALQNYISVLDFLKVNITTIEIDPHIAEVGREFFGFQQTDTNRIIIADGITYSKDLNAKGEKFDFIILDASTSDHTKEVICPIEQFRQPEIIATMADLVKPNGGLVVNIYAVKNVNENEEKILSAFSKEFSTCFLLRYSDEQRLLICSHRPEWNLQMKGKRFLDELIEHEKMIGVKLSENLLKHNSFE